jgi:hypothetical protein
VNLFELIQQYSNYIILITAILAFLSIIIAISNSIKTHRVIRRYKRLMRGIDNKNLEAMLTHHLNSVENVLVKVEDLEHNFKLIVNNLEYCLQNVGIVRYNPFAQMGGDLSFSLALLDKNGDGIVLTGLFSRNSSSVYAKPITDGSSTYPLSQEEIQAIQKAMAKTS